MSALARCPRSPRNSIPVEISPPKQRGIRTGASTLLAKPAYAIVLHQQRICSGSRYHVSIAVEIPVQAAKMDGSQRV